MRADRPALVEALADLAVKDTGLPLLRLYWYDAAPNRVPFPDQRELGRLATSSCGSATSASATAGVVRRRASMPTCMPT